MRDPNRPPSDQEAAQQDSPLQQPPDDAEGQPADALPAESLPTLANPTEDLVADETLASSIESKLNYEAHLRAAQLRAIHGR